MGPRSPGNRRPHFFWRVRHKAKTNSFLFKFELIISINFKEFLKLSILLSGNESRLRFPNTFRLKNECLTKQYVLRRTVYNGKVILDKTNFKYT